MKLIPRLGFEIKGTPLKNIKDGPASPLFKPLSYKGSHSQAALKKLNFSKDFKNRLHFMPSGLCTFRGIPFKIQSLIVIKNKALAVKIKNINAPYLIFLHTSDRRKDKINKDGFISPMYGEGKLNEHAANYIVKYSDGSESKFPIKRRHQIGDVTHMWGEECFEAVASRKDHTIPSDHEQIIYSSLLKRRISGWGRSQTKVKVDDTSNFLTWLWAWENPFPKKKINSIVFEPVTGTSLIFGISAGRVSSFPLKWKQREKAILTLPKNQDFSSEMDEYGLLKQIKLDLGQIISAKVRHVYPNSSWEKTRPFLIPKIKKNEVLIEYTAHPEALFYLQGNKRIPLSKLKMKGKLNQMEVVNPAYQRVTITTRDSNSKEEVPVKLHVHGETGEYLPPVDHHRDPNPSWFEDYSADWVHGAAHFSAYIPGRTTIDLPIGKVYIEISKGFEIKPVKKIFIITKATGEIIIDLKKVLPWREKGWVTADTHVHFISPQTAMLEGAAEDVNIINLLASQWGELMTNVGDFDGKTTFGSKKSGGDGEYLVRVGTENRQHVMGHISLIGYSGNIIAPMTVGGPVESAIGDPLSILLTEWAKKCKKQDGLVIIPHFPNPRAENAATIVSGNADGIEMCSWGNLYMGISPYSLSDYYRYLNCGYKVAIVGGTDKMNANTAVGTIRTYGKISPDKEFDYETWKDAIRRAETFVSYGPLLEFKVDGKPMGSNINMEKNGGRVEVVWKAASVSIPMTRIDLIVNGEIKESKSLNASEDEGTFSIQISKSSWAALLIRGKYQDKPEIITAHSSPVMIEVKGSVFSAAADAITILEQIEGAMAYLDTVSTKAEVKRYKEMRMVLESAHRSLHNRMHQMGQFHDHSVLQSHH